MKLCILSGTFNPIHNGHILMAEFLLKTQEVEKIIFIPAFNPPQKSTEPELALHRLKMTELATASNPAFEVSDIEYKLGGKSYSYLTILELYKKYKIDGKIKFVIGTDAFENLDSWYESEKLRKIVDFVVFVRKNDFNEKKYEKMKEKGYNFSFAPMEFHDISSTNIRNKAKQKKSIAGLVPEVVERYIKENDLYKN